MGSEYGSDMISKLFVTGFLFVFIVLSSNDAALASFIIQSQEAVEIELKGYSGLNDTILFKGSLSSGTEQTIDTSYQGFALLIFNKGQRYPLILGKQSFTLHLTGPDHLPSFTGSSENEFFYKLLTDAEPGPGQYAFALLMMQAKELLDSSHSIHTVAELKAMKEKFYAFVRTHYLDLQHSDMVRRLIAQYFMMHEYVDYHIEGSPATDIRVQYQKAVVNGVENWLEILKKHIPDHEILNYCVSLYYKRSMVTLASLIIENFKDVAYCPGVEKKTFSFPGDLLITEAHGDKKRTLNEFKETKIIAFVSDDCPVSMVETVAKARQLAAQNKNVKLIVAPLQPLSEKHLIMGRMLANGNIFFINDEKWRKKNQLKDIQLPLFVNIATSKL